MPSPGLSASGTDEFAEADAIFQGSTIVAGKQVDDFAKALDQHTVLRGSPAEKRAQIFKLVDHYYEYNCKRVEALRSQAKNARRSSSRGLFTGAPVGGPVRRPSAMDIDEGDNRSVSAIATSTIEEEMQEVEEEVQTWDLLRHILPLRYRDSHHTANVRSSIESAPRSRSEFWEEFVIADSTARERKVVLEWLQNTASRGPPIDDVVKELQQKADRGDIISHGWLHTKHKIKLQKTVNGRQGVLDPHNPALANSHLGSNTLITQLDPDAMTRQGRKLEPSDESFERAIWLGCFEMLRRGHTMAEIRAWCAERQESWRAASISALELSSAQDEDVEGEDFVPIFAVLWRRMCYAAARDGGHSDYERAVYGLLSGDITSVEKVAKTWDDFLFLHYNALLRTQFDNFLIKHSGAEGLSTAQAFPSFNAVQHHGEPVSLGRRLISTLEGSEKTKLEALSPAKALQGAIVANDLDRFLYNQGAVIAKDANKQGPSKLIPNVGGHVLDDVFKSKKYVKLGDHDALRLVTHLFIIITSLDQLMGPEDSSRSSKFGNRFNYQEHILAGYISYLRLTGQIDLIPLYSSKLNGDRRYTTLCRNLIEITGQVARENQLGVMKKLGLDLEKFALTGPKVFLADVNEEEATCEAKGSFKILKDVPLLLQYGRPVKEDFFGEDAEFVDDEDEKIIRAIEWLMLVPGLFDETVDFVIRAHTYFLSKSHRMPLVKLPSLTYYVERMRLRAARSLVNRVSLKSIVSVKTNYPMPQELDDMTVWMDEFMTQIRDSQMVEGDLPRRTQHYNVKVLWQLESLVKALDSIETIASMAHLIREQVNSDNKHHLSSLGTNTADREPLNTNKELWKEAHSEIRALKSCMTPILNGWLTDVYGPDVPQSIQDLREAYIPETVLAYISSLHFVGTFGTRDHLMECMDLAAQIADKESDITGEFLKAGRLKELVEAFASASKALAVSTSEKGGRDSIAKKNREMGWSRELWSVKQ